MNKPIEPNSFRTGPDEQGMFGMFGGRFVAETLMPLILDLEREWNAAKARSGLQGRTVRAFDALCRPALEALFRRRPDEHISAAQRSISSARI